MLQLLSFCAGLGAGTFITLIFLVYSIGRTNQRTIEKNREIANTTAELMRERNRLDEFKIQYLERVAMALERK